MAKQKHKSKYFSPNHIPKADRTVNIILAVLLVLYGLIGLLADDIYIPGKRTRGFHFHGPPASIAFASFMCFVLYLLTIVLDHYDCRNNERRYVQFRKFARFMGYTLLIVAVFVDCFFYHLITR
ncbi:MAG: hypothetical protein IPH32_15705 [Bacteroidetes bacterium]|nr:hypothetical protein [Bacteroidota bacterium]